MYQDPKRWSYIFQSYVLLTMMELHHKKTVSNNNLTSSSSSLYTFRPILSVCWREVYLVLDTAL